MKKKSKILGGQNFADMSAIIELTPSLSYIYDVEYWQGMGTTFGNTIQLVTAI